MKILVCVSCVPDTTAKITFKSDNKSVDSNGMQFIINPNDEIALSKALELTADGTSGTVTVICVGNSATEPVIRKALAIGANDSVRIHAEPADASYTAFQIADYAKKNNFDLILTGSESIDYNGSVVPGMLAEMLGIPFISCVKSFVLDGSSAIVEREIEGGKEKLSCTLPVLLSAYEGLAEPRIPNMRGIMGARTKPLVVIEPIEAPCFTEITTFDKPKARGQVNLVPSDNMEKLVELLHEEAKVI